MSYEKTLQDLLQQLVAGKADHDQKIQQSNTKIEEMLEALKAPAADAVHGPRLPAAAPGGLLP